MCQKIEASTKVCSAIMTKNSQLEYSFITRQQPQNNINVRYEFWWGRKQLILLCVKTKINQREPKINSNIDRWFRIRESHINKCVKSALGFDLSLKLILTDISISDIIILAKRYKIPLSQTIRCQKETSDPCVNILIL